MVRSDEKQMRVKCTAIEKDGSRLVTGSTESLAVGREYLVLAISIEFDRESSYQVVSDNEGTPIWKGVSYFEVVDARIPSVWSVFQRRTGGPEIGPVAWYTWRGRFSFWEDY